MENILYAVLYFIEPLYDQSTLGSCKMLEKCVCHLSICDLWHGECHPETNVHFYIRNSFRHLCGDFDIVTPFGRLAYTFGAPHLAARLTVRAPIYREHVQ